MDGENNGQIPLKWMILRGTPPIFGSTPMKHGPKWLSCRTRIRTTLDRGLSP